MKKVCTKCGIDKNVVDFHKASKGRFGVSSVCKVCKSTISKEYDDKIRNIKGIKSNTDKLLDRIGEEFLTTEGYLIKIISCKNYKNCTVQFEDGVTLTNKGYSRISKGNIKNLNHKSVYNYGYVGYGKYRTTSAGKLTTIYKKWNGMLERCYSEDCHKKQPTYIGCSVDERWHNFQVFASWYEENYKSHMEGWHLDKDILFKGNKIYSPETCCFVPAEVNSLFIKCNKNRGILPIGVTRYKKRYRAFISKKDTQERYLGTFDTLEEAFQAYKTAKEMYVKEVADKYRGQITEQIYQVMYDYKVEIND